MKRQGDPLMRRRNISLPVDDELELSSPSMDIQDVPDSVCSPSIDNLGGRRGLGQRDQVQLSDRPSLEREVLRRKAELLVRLIGRGRSPVSIGLPL